MTKDIKLVVLDANFYWTESLFSAFSEYADVLLLYPRDFRAFYRIYGRYFIDINPQKVSERLYKQHICLPPGWLFHYWFLTEKFFAWLVHRFQQQSKLILVLNYPFYSSLIKNLNALSIYYSIDDYQDYWSKKTDQTPTAEKNMITNADLTLCVAKYRANLLQENYPDKKTDIIHLPHGCSRNFMVDTPLDKPEKLPPAIGQISRPIAGYIGALNYRFDFHYLVQVAEKMPDINFVLGGQLPNQSDGSEQWWQAVKLAQSLTNVHFIGKVPHQQLGEYLQSFDILLIIYSDCQFNLNACPTKLWDYMGTSLPVVANNIVPEVNLWQNVILVANHPDDFVQKIRFCLDDPTWQSQQRLEIAKAHTWEKQAEKLYRILQERGVF